MLCLYHTLTISHKLCIMLSIQHATEATERIDCTPAIKLLQRYASKHTQNKNKILSHTFFSINLKCIDKYIWQFLIFTGIGLTA